MAHAWPDFTQSVCDRDKKNKSVPISNERHAEGELIKAGFACRNRPRDMSKSL